MGGFLSGPFILGSIDKTINWLSINHVFDPIQGQSRYLISSSIILYFSSCGERLLLGPIFSSDFYDSINSILISIGKDLTPYLPASLQDFREMVVYSHLYLLFLLIVTSRYALQGVSATCYTPGGRERTSPPSRGFTCTNHAAKATSLVCAALLTEPPDNYPGRIAVEMTVFVRTQLDLHNYGAKAAAQIQVG